MSCHSMNRNYRPTSHPRLLPPFNLTFFTFPPKRWNFRSLVATPSNLGIARKFLRFLKLFTVGEIFNLVTFC